MDLKKLLSWIPGWLGFLLLIIVGILMSIHGFLNPLGVALTHTNVAGFQTFGLCAILVGAFSWIVGAVSKITGKEGKFGIRIAIGDMPWWAWVVDIGIVVISVIVFIVRTRA